jgi:hypothetical protein
VPSAAGDDMSEIPEKQTELEKQCVTLLSAPEKPYEPLSEIELKKIAMDVVNGRIFCSLSIPQHDASVLPLVFMPLALAGSDYGKWCVDNQIHVLYEYMDKRLKMGINGYPIFAGMRLLNKSDAERMVAFTQLYAKANDEFLKGGKP